MERSRLVTGARLFFSRKWIRLSLLGIVIVLAGLQVGHHMGREQIKMWDESSSARNAVEMLASKHFFIVHTNGEPNRRDVKPPLQLWLKVLSFRIFGINEFAVRFPTLVAALLTMIIFTFFFVRYLRSYSLAFWYVITMAVTTGYMGYHVARHGDPDTLLTFFVSVYFIATFLLLETYPANRIRNLFLLGTGVLLAVYTKSIAGLAPLAGIAVYFISVKNGRRLLTDRRFHLTWIGVVVLIGAYYVIRGVLDRGYLAAVYMLEFQTFTSYHGAPPKHPEFSFYFNYLRKEAFYPQFYFLPLAAVPLIWSRNWTLRRLLVYSISATVFFLLGHSFATTKNEWYIAPVYPFIWTWFTISVVETVRIAARLFRQKFFRYIWITAVTITALVYAGNRYLDIREINKRAYTVTRVYVLERAGYLLREFKETYADPVEMTIYTTRDTRQLDFYTKKYAYLEQSEFLVTDSLESSFAGRMILSTEKDFLEKADSLYQYEVLFENKYGAVIQTH